MKISDFLWSYIPAGQRHDEARNRWVAKELEKIKHGSRVLDAGAGPQKYRPFCSHLDYVSQDFCQYDGEGNSEGLQTGSWDIREIDIVSDITSIPEPAASFDVIICTEVFEHIPEPMKAVAEFYRLLKPGGVLLFTAPFCSLSHFAPYHYHSGFSEYFYRHNFSLAGFELDTIEANGNYFEFLALELRRVISVAEKYSEKKPTFFNRLAIWFALLAVNRFSKYDSGSQKLMNCGYHVRALKPGQPS